MECLFFLMLKESGCIYRVSFTFKYIFIKLHMCSEIYVENIYINIKILTLTSWSSEYQENTEDIILPVFKLACSVTWERSYRWPLHCTVVYK